MTAIAQLSKNSTRRLLDLVFRFRVPLTWVVAIAGFAVARPTPGSIPIGAAWAAVGLVWRAWAAGTIRKNVELAVDGPYARSRHPLYFGNFMLASGFAAASGRLWVLAVVIGLTLLVFIPLIRDEEAAMVARFGNRYREYMRAVPRMVPGRRRFAGAVSRNRFSWRRYLENHEYNALIGYSAAVAALVALCRLHPG